MSFCLSTEFIIEYEESQWEPGNWKELLRVLGNHNSAVLKLHGHVDYRFRVSGVNDIGRGPPSEPSERYKTPPSGPAVFLLSFLLRVYIKSSRLLPTYRNAQTCQMIDFIFVERLLACASAQYRLSSTWRRQQNLYSFISTAPDKNPENIRIEGHLPHEMDINWEVRHTACSFVAAGSSVMSAVLF